MSHRNLLFASSLLLAGLFFPGDVFASVLSLSPGGGNITKGGTLTVQVMLNTQGESVNAVTANLSYPADKLEASASFGASAFSIAAEESVGGGSIKISRGSVSGATGNVNVATLKLKAKGSGSALLSFSPGSAVPKTSDSSDSLNLGGSQGGTYNIVEATSTPTTPGKPTEPTPETPKDITPPKITEVNVTNLSQKTATVTWKTDEKADSVVEYGLVKEQYFLTVSKPDLVSDHSLALESLLLTPGLELHFRIKSKDASGNLSSGEDKTFKLKGFRVTVKVVDVKNKPLVKTSVVLYSDPIQATTDERGLAVFEDVSPGKHLLVVKAGKQEKTSEIAVASDQDNQSFSVNVDTSAVRKGSNIENLVYGAIGFSVVLLSIIAGVLLLIRHRNS